MASVTYRRYFTIPPIERSKLSTAPLITQSRHLPQNAVYTSGTPQIIIPNRQRPGNSNWQNNARSLPITPDFLATVTGNGLDGVKPAERPLPTVVYVSPILQKKTENKVSDPKPGIAALAASTVPTNKESPIDPETLKVTSNNADETNNSDRIDEREEELINSAESDDHNFLDNFYVNFFGDESDDDDEDDSDDDFSIFDDSDDEDESGKKRRMLKTHMNVMKCLMQMQSYVDDNDECDEKELIRSIQQLNYMFANEDIRTSTSPTCVAFGVIELCQEICAPSFKKQDLLDEKLLRALGCVQNVTDVSPEGCKRVLECGLYKQLFDLTRSAGKNLSTSKLTSEQYNGMLRVLGVLHNVIQAQPVARELYRKQNALTVLEEFRKHSDSVRLITYALILQAYVINEDENAVIAANETPFTFLAKELQDGIISAREGHRSPSGFKAIELLAAVNKLAVNDDNKLKIIAAGFLESYVHLLGPECSVEEQSLAAQGLWTMAKTCSVDIRQTKGCEEALRKLFESTQDADVRLNVQGTLESLGIIVKTSGSSKMPVGTQKGHVFISYNHKSEAVVHRIKDHLKDAAISVWIDCEQIHKGLTLEDAIAAGIDSASIVLVCISQGYYESPMCQRECRYACNNNKKVVTIRVEPGYNSHGWLPLLVGGGFRHDFSLAKKFHESMERLIETIIHESKSIPVNKSVDTVDGPIAATHTNRQVLVAAPNTSAVQNYTGGHGSAAYSSELENKVLSWKTADVKQWLKDNGLERLQEWFKEFDGKLLLEYKKFMRDMSEIHAACVQRELQRGKLNMTDVLKLNVAFRQL